MRETYWINRQSAATSAGRLARALGGAAALLLGPAGMAAASDFELQLEYNAQQSSLFQDLGSPVPLPGSPTSTSQDIDISEWRVTGRWFLDGLDDVGGPLAEAAFLQRASYLNVGAGYGRFESTRETRLQDGSVDRAGFSESGRQLSLAMHLQLPAPDWFIDAAASFAELDDNQSRVLSVGVGRYFGERTTLSAGVSREERDGGGFERDDTYVYLDGKHLGDLPSGWQYTATLGLDNAEVNFEDGIRYRAGLTLYPNDRLGFGASYRGSSVSDVPGEWGLHGNWFINENIELSIAYSLPEDPDFGNAEGVSYDADGFSVGLRWRF